MIRLFFSGPSISATPPQNTGLTRLIVTAASQPLDIGIDVIASVPSLHSKRGGGGWGVVVKGVSGV